MSRLESPNGVNRRSVRKKHAASNKSTRILPLQNGMTHRPSVLKEGHLHKPSFFRFGGKKRRWCVLRTYSSSEASLDIFMDDTKTRYKGTIRLDKDLEPILMIKSEDSSSANHKTKLQSSYLVLKVGKNVYHFATDSFTDLKEWCALIRQVIDNDGSLFSANVVEPNNASIEGVVNVQFTSNYIALICPVREISLKRWRLEHITSFGQCGGILTFECCPRCSDPAANRCSLNIKQEKPATILSLMEKAVREHPNTNEIHYERSILGDIYHCSHTCTSPRLFSAVSDPNITRINGIGSPRMNRKKPETSVPPPELHKSEFDLVMIHSNTLESNDSGLPGTPQLEDSPRSSSIILSPSCSSGGKPSPTKLSPRDKLPSPPAFRARSSSSNDSGNNHLHRENTPGRDTDDELDFDSRGITYAKVDHSDRNTVDNVASGLPASTVTYSQVRKNKADSPSRQITNPSTYNKLSPVQLSRKDSAPVPPERKESRFRKSSGSPPCIQAQCTSPSRGFQIPSGSVPPPPQKLLKKAKTDGDFSGDLVRDCSEDRDQPVASFNSEPSPRGRSGTHFVQRELPPQPPRERCQSHSETVIQIPPRPPKARGVSKSTSDELDEDFHDPYKFDSLAELKSTNPFFRLDEEVYDETDNEEGAMEVMSNLLDYRRRKKHDPYCQPSVVDKVLSKVACDNVRGYAYQISIPSVDVIYAVPRREAPIPNTKNVNRDGPPKPLRKTGSSYFTNGGQSLSQPNDCLHDVATQA